MKKASNHQIWKANKTVLAKTSVSNPKIHNRRHVVEAGELVEFRFWSPATFRTIDELYLCVDEKEFYDSFEFIGDIFNQVAMRNQNTTKQILECELYTKENSHDPPA